MKLIITLFVLLIVSSKSDVLCHDNAAEINVMNTLIDNYLNLKNLSVECNSSLSYLMNSVEANEQWALECNSISKSLN
jgi:hypothetical protein